MNFNAIIFSKIRHHSQISPNDQQTTFKFLFTISKLKKKSNIPYTLMSLTGSLNIYNLQVSKGFVELLIYKRTKWNISFIELVCRVHAR